MFKVYKKNINEVVLVFLLTLEYIFIPVSRVSISDFEQINVSWEFAEIHFVLEAENSKNNHQLVSELYFC